MSGRMRMYLVVNRVRFRGLKVLTVIFHFIFIFYFFSTSVDDGENNYNYYYEVSFSRKPR